MKYPIDEQKFVERWLSAIGEHDEADRELAVAVTQAINRAYAAGVVKGRGEGAR